MTFPMIVTDDLERIMATPSTPKPAPTLVCYAELQAAYAFFNERLFEGALPGALLTMPRHSNNPGYFSADRFGNIEGERLSEIAMNPGYFTNRPVEDVLSHLVHNQAHQYRLVAFPSPPRRGYHDREWASVMLRIGLKPTTTGMPDGKETGDTVDHIIIADGPFMRACQELLATDFRITWFDRYPTTAPAQFGYLTAPNVLDAGQGSGGATSYIIIAPDRTPPPESLDRLSGNSGASAPEIIGSVALGNLSPTAKTGATSPSLPPEYVVTALPPDQSA